MIDLEDGECYSTAHHKGKRDHKCNSIRPRGNKSSGNLPIVIFEFLVLVAGWEQAAGNFHVSNKLVHLQRAHEQARRVEPQLLHLRHPPANQSELRHLPCVDGRELRLLEVGALGGALKGRLGEAVVSSLAGPETPVHLNY
jgi:hypothetical protein